MLMFEEVLSTLLYLTLLAISNILLQAYSGIIYAYLCLLRLIEAYLETWHIQAYSGIWRT